MTRLPKTHAASREWSSASLDGPECSWQLWTPALDTLLLIIQMIDLDTKIGRLIVSDQDASTL